MPKIFAHGSYIGNTGYNNHTREFFRHLSKHAQKLNLEILLSVVVGRG
jgi:hypothetical protein